MAPIAGRQHLIVAGALFAFLHCWPLPAVGDKATLEFTTSAKGLYRVALIPYNVTPRPGRMHSWVVYVETADGQPFEPRQLAITGGMPGHGHGLPTQPRATRKLPDGGYLIAGMKFNMAGTWDLVVGVSGPAGPDQALFNYDLPAVGTVARDRSGRWTEAQVQLIRSLWLGSLPDREPDPSNRMSANHLAAELGKRLFFDTGLSATAEVACSSCHIPEQGFADGRRLSFGSSETSRHSPGLLGVGYQQWFYWDGRRDSLWSQAITPIETPGEMDSNRVDAVRYVAGNETYSDLFEELTGNDLTEFLDDNRFPAGASPFAKGAAKLDWYRMNERDRRAVNGAFADIGKAIAAYLETLMFTGSRFDLYAESLAADRAEPGASALTDEELDGLALFIDLPRSQCLRCHNGPLFTNFGFHNVGSATNAAGRVDYGRRIGLEAAKLDEFNCTGLYNDARQHECAELVHAAVEETSVGAFKVPSLRNVARTAPYFHDGRFDSLDEVMEFYRHPPDNSRPTTEMPPITLTDAESAQLIAFLKSLSDIE